MVMCTLKCIITNVAWWFIYLFLLLIEISLLTTEGLKTTNRENHFIFHRFAKVDNILSSQLWLSSHSNLATSLRKSPYAHAIPMTTIKLNILKSKVEGVKNHCPWMSCVYNYESVCHPNAVNTLVHIIYGWLPLLFSVSHC